MQISVLRLFSCICCLIFLLLCFDFHMLSSKENKNFNFYNYIDKEIFSKYKITERSWCSIEIESYLLFFFMCYNRIPNIGKFSYYKCRMLFKWKEFKNDNTYR